MSKKKECKHYIVEYFVEGIGHESSCIHCGKSATQISFENMDKVRIDPQQKQFTKWSEADV